MRILTVLSILLMSVLGCAILNQPTFEIASSRITCDENPQFVDGNLETMSTFGVNGHIEKKYQILNNERLGVDNPERRYVTKVEGSLRTDALIKLDTPTYITYVDIYPGSRIPKLALTTTLEDPPRLESSFDVVTDKQHITVEARKPVRFQINREILYLRLTADAIEDRQNAIREKKEIGSKKKKNKKIDMDSRIQIPLKGASIREVKFYSRQK